MNPVEPAALTVPAAATYLSISVRQVWYLIKAGRIQTITIGRRRRLILRDELERALRDGSLSTLPKESNGDDDEAAA